MAIALLSEVNYEGFDEEGDLLRAYIPSHLYDERELRMFAKNQKLSFSVEKMGASMVLPLIAIFKVLKTRQTILSTTIANKSTWFIPAQQVATTNATSFCRIS